jgi:hypothetical protein
VTAAVLVAAGLGPAPAAAQPSAARGAVVIVGVPGLRWSDVSAAATPGLWRLAGRGGAASLSVRAAGPVTPPADGWVTLGAGNRATGRPALDEPDPYPLTARPGGGDGFDALRKRNDELSFDARTGALGAALRAAGVPTVAFGPWAAVAVATPDGAVDEVWPLPVTPAGIASRLPGGLGAGRRRRDRGRRTRGRRDSGLAGAGRRAGGCGRQQPAAPRHAAARRRERRWTEPPQLRVAIAVGPAFPVGTMRSALTRRDGFVQLIDLAPTVVELTGAQRVDGMVGRSWTGVGTDRALEPRVESFVDADEAAAGYRTYVQPFFILLFVLQVLLYGAAYVALRRLRGQPAQGRIGG